MSNPKTPEDDLVLHKSPKSVRSMFTDISSTYDLLNHVFSLNIDKRWRSKLARQTLISASKIRILDVCGGTGDLALALAQEAKRSKTDIEIICSDFTPSMMEIAKTKIEKQLDPQSVIIPVVADTTQLPFPDNSFELVTVAFGIRNVSDPLIGLHEMARVCKPGGQLAVLEFSRTRSKTINWAFNFYFTRILPAIGRMVTGTRAYSYLSKSVDAFPEGAEFCNLLTKATGGTSTATPLSCGIATLYLSTVNKSK